MSLQKIKLSEIDLGKRYREDYGNSGELDELIKSIKEYGLIHPIAVGLHPDQNSEKTFLLAAGGRRFVAFNMLAVNEPENESWHSINCHVYDKVLDELELRNIELEENLRRKNLDYREEVYCKRELLRIQEEIHGKKTSTSPNATGISMSDVAKKLGVTKATMSYDINLADIIDQFPDAGWDKCKNKSEAVRLKKTIEKTIVQKALAERATKEIGKGDKRIKNLCDSYIIGDFFEKVKRIPDGVVNLVEIDPPYAINLEQQKRNYDKNYKGYNEIAENRYKQFMDGVFKECYRVMADDSWLLCWFGPEPWFETIYELISKNGFLLRRMPGIWNKGTGQIKSPEMNMANNYEMFFYARKGSPKLSKPGRANVLDFKPVPHSQKHHPTERPLDLMTELLGTFGKPNDSLMVPFAGSGVSLIAGAKLNMKPFGFDLTEDFKDGYVLKLKENLND